MVSMAFRECYLGAPGPSHLEIGRDILDSKVPLRKAVVPQPGHYRFSTESVGDPADVEKLADILVRSKKPCVLLGTQVWTCRATDAAIRRSEERRVGQECVSTCSSRWAPYHQKKKTDTPRQVLANTLNMNR